MRPFLLLLFATSQMFVASAQDTIPSPISKLNDRLDEILSSTAQVEKLPGKYKFTEGPIWNKAEGFLIFSDVPANVIYKYVPGQEPSVFMQKSGYTESDSLPTKNAGSNGLVYDAKGNLIICRHGDRNVVSLSPKGELKIVAGYYQGKRLSSPNDVCIQSNGAIFFSDPPYGLNKNRPQEVRFNGLFRVMNGEISVIDSTLQRPNGVAFSPDEKYLYANNTDKNRMIWKRYTLDKTGKVTSDEILFDATSMNSAPGNPDGMKVDKKGNIWAAGPGGMLIISPEGKLLGVVKLPEIMTNCAFGDADGKTLYITARTGVYKIRTLVPGNGF